MVCTTRDCPPLPPDCPPQFVSTDSAGCCPRCARPQSCSLLAAPSKETGPGSIELKVSGHSGCRNVERINNWNTCQGTCSSGHVFHSGLLPDYTMTL